MESRPGEHRIPLGWWAFIMVAVAVVFVAATSTIFAGTLRPYLPVTLTSDRAGLVLETNAKVKMRGVEVGRVGAIDVNKESANLRLEIYPDQAKYIPANVGAQIRVTTIFGAKFVDLVYPDNPSSARLAAGAVLHSTNVTSEVNTVFENVVDLLNMVDPAKLNSVLAAVAEGVRGQGERIGQATTDLNQVLLALNARSDTIREDWRSFKRFNDTFASAANDLVTILNAASTTSKTVVDHSAALDKLLLNVVGMSTAGTDLLATSKDKLVSAVNTLAPTTNLLLKYNPEYTCWLQGAKWALDNGGYYVYGGGDGRSLIFDVSLLPGKDGYQYPDNLPIVAAKGGPGGKPGCGSLPDASKNFPIRQLITDTGFGTGTDWRPNPGIGHPCYADYFPQTRAVPEAPKIRQCIPGPAVGPVPYAGAPPYGAPLYAPGGVPLWSGVPPAPPNPADAQQPQPAPDQPGAPLPAEAGAPSP
ncbi:MCE family protein [Mycobacterium sp. OTB74]|jgi:phospholipid/cholesterol/gamma-HCH transport system substrate-binding protein|uniref:MCE family protein n=1 Tax=Mycobacterium sp. OTB74 TaxID=1853452 RepID=UPI002474E12E|nr:MCE family protein [Mycobacterium sp. OTB74]MDH6246407.1 phospholipid/cholesterol/gamma-HCH transport system substrate-binding protein [Mycobacterium sp. OTB74]